ncbi:MAG: hypothetical protein HC918_06920 [Oscillatoriales cyanobacterium SM2_1_8]|nr:hypothetical protein [Oscillatoriales cyanobacterium SM2_1_8]
MQSLPLGRMTMDNDISFAELAAKLGEGAIVASGSMLSFDLNKVLGLTQVELGDRKVAAFMMQILGAAAAAQAAYNETHSPPLKSYEGGKLGYPYSVDDRLWVDQSYSFYGRIPIDLKMGTGKSQS